MPKEQNSEVKAGKLFCISRGKYSDYGYCGHFLALQDITRKLLQEIVDECNSEKETLDDVWDASDLFMPKLIRRGLVIDIDVQEIHTGSYGELYI